MSLDRLSIMLFHSVFTFLRSPSLDYNFDFLLSFCYNCFFLVSFKFYLIFYELNILFKVMWEEGSGALALLMDQPPLLCYYLLVRL